MKNNRSIFRISPAVLLLFFTQLLTGQTFSNNKSYERTYRVTPETTVEINNKYGKIHVIPWDKDSVKITASMSVYSNNLTRLEKVKNGINFNFTDTRYYISAITDFGTSSNQILTELKTLSDVLISGQNQIEINYLVYCPSHINLNLVNKFGDIYIDDIVGNLKISLSNGDLKINSVEGEAQIEIAFGSGIINDLREGQLTVSYSDIKVKDAMKLILDSKSSTINVDKADYIKATSRRDKYFVNTVESFYCNSEFSQLWIESLQCEADCILKYGSLSLSSSKKDLCTMNLNSEYADINLTLPQGSRYEADIFYPDGASVNFPVNKEKYGFRNDREGSTQWHAYLKSAAGEGLAKLRIYATQKSYISLIEK
jgi:hypothetical protein